MKLSSLLKATESYVADNRLGLSVRNGSIRIVTGAATAGTLFRAIAGSITGHTSEALAYNGLQSLLGETNYAAAMRAMLQGHYMNNPEGRRARWIRRLLMRRLRLKSSQDEARYV